MSATKTAARIWLASHVGQILETTQTSVNGRVWEPGPRLLSQAGSRFYLNNSQVTNLHHGVTVNEVTADHIDLYDADFGHRTVYRIA